MQDARDNRRQHVNTSDELANDRRMITKKNSLTRSQYIGFNYTKHIPLLSI